MSLWSLRIICTQKKFSVVPDTASEDKTNVFDNCFLRMSFRTLNVNVYVNVHMVDK